MGCGKTRSRWGSDWDDQFRQGVVSAGHGDSLSTVLIFAAGDFMPICIVFLWQELLVIPDTLLA